MRCPYCEFEDTRMKVHGHLWEAHREEVKTERDAESGRLWMEVVCPECGEGYRREVNPRGRDPEFLQAFERQVKLVAFDILLYHMRGEH